MTKVIIDYSTNRLIKPSKFLFERKVTTSDIQINSASQEELHNAIRQKILEIEQATESQIKVNACMTINS